MGQRICMQGEDMLIDGRYDVKIRAAAMCQSV